MSKLNRAAVPKEIFPPIKDANVGTATVETKNPNVVPIAETISLALCCAVHSRPPYPVSTGFFMGLINSKIIF